MFHGGKGEGVKSVGNAAVLELAETTVLGAVARKGLAGSTIATRTKMVWF